MEKKISTQESRIVTVSGGTTESPITFDDIREHLDKDPHHIIDYFKECKPEIYRHLVGLLISFYKESWAKKE